MTDQTLVLANGLFLMSWWAPLIVVVVFAGWAWVVSTIYDKDTARYYLPRRRWNMVHMLAGTIAFLAVLLVPLPWYATIPIAIAILAADLAIYFVSRNGDERVPASRKWTLDLSKMRERAAEKKKTKNVAGSTLVMKGPSGVLGVPPKDSPEYEVRTGAETLVIKLSEARGSQLDIAPLRDGSYGVTALVDGVRQTLEAAPIPASQAIAYMDFFKSVAGLDLQDRRRKLQGDFKYGAGGPTGPMTTARIITMGSAAGMQLSLLLDPEAQVRRTIEEIGLIPNQLEDVKRSLEDRKGVVLLAAPLDNGRTTTFYALIRAHDAYTSNVQTMELDPQMVIEGVRQNRFDPKVDGAEYSTTVRSILRRDPDVVGIAEMPDENTAKEISKSDTDRTRVYLSLPADGAFTAMQIYAKAVGDQKAAAKSLYGVFAQRLARKLCENCRVAFQPTPDMLKKLGLPADTKQLYRKGGQVLLKDKPVTCPVCNGSGFFGQIGVFEIYPFGQAERDLFAANDLTGLKAAFRQKKQQSIQQSALMHAISGATSVEEVVRITQPPASAASKESGSSPPATPPVGQAPSNPNPKK